MGIEDYYFSRKGILRMGKMYFLKDLQEAGTPGGGRSLLGSIVQEVREKSLGIFVSKEYPVPMHMSVPGVILEAIESRRSQLGFSDSNPIVLPQSLIPAQRSLTIDRKFIFGVGAGPFPSVPANLGIDIDYGRARKIALSFGQGTKREYIPLGYLARLYEHVGGDPASIDITLAENNVVTSILVTKNLKVTFESKAKFDAEFKAKLESLGSVPEIGAEVAYNMESDKKVVAKLSGKTEYLVALAVRDWDDFDLK
jgi:hypothetical protein